MTTDKIQDTVDAIIIGVALAILLAFSVFACKVGGFQALLGILAIALPAFLLGRARGQRDVLKALEKKSD